MIFFNSSMLFLCQPKPFVHVEQHVDTFLKFLWVGLLVSQIG